MLYRCLRRKKCTNPLNSARTNGDRRVYAEVGESKNALSRPNIAHFRLPKNHIPQRKDEDHDGRLQNHSSSAFWIELVANAIGCSKNGTFSWLARKRFRGGASLKNVKTCKRSFATDKSRHLPMTRARINRHYIQYLQ